MASIYDRDVHSINFKTQPELYLVGRGEQGVLIVEPYKAEILPSWRFKTPREASESARKITALFEAYKSQEDFVGMDMARKFLQMGFTRARRYANHPSGRKYDQNGKLLIYENDEIKARSAAIFKKAWDKVERDETYRDLRTIWRAEFG